MERNGVRKSGRPFPPKQVADLSKQSASNFVKLVKRLQHGVTLVLGAGVSSSAGIPFWSQLLERMCSGFFEHWQFDIQLGRGSSDKPPTNMSIAFAEYTFHSVEAQQLGKSLASSNLLLAAQQIKNCIRDVDFLYLLRHSLFDPIQYTPCSSKLLESLSRLCGCKQATVRSVISYNYDDLIAYALASNKVAHERSYEGGKNADEDRCLPIYFVHGIMPIKGGYSSRIVLAETDYQQESASPFAWGNQSQLQQFSKRTCIFIGNSMTDPNSRRLLRLSRTTSACPHFCFLPCSESPDDKLFDALFDYDLAQIGVFPIRFPKNTSGTPNVDPYERLPQLIDLLKAAAENPGYIWS